MEEKQAVEEKEEKEGKEEKELIEQEDGDDGVEIVMGTPLPLPPPAPMHAGYQEVKERQQYDTHQGGIEGSEEEKNGLEGTSEWVSTRRTARSRAPSHPRMQKQNTWRIDEAVKEEEEDASEEVKENDPPVVSSSHESEALVFSSPVVEGDTARGDDVVGGILPESETKPISGEAASSSSATPYVNDNHQESITRDLGGHSDKQETEVSELVEVTGDNRSNDMDEVTNPQLAATKDLDTQPTSIPVATTSNNESASGTLQPELSEWITCMSESGHPYYYNQFTNECRWQLPQSNDQNIRDTFAAIASSNEFKYLESALGGGLDPNTTDDSGLTLLHQAVQAGNEFAVDLLVAYGADVDRASIPEMITPLLMACKLGKLHLFKILFECGGSLSTRDSFGHSPAHFCILSGNNSLLGSVLDAANRSGIPIVNWQNNDGETPLHLAARLGNADAVKALLNCGADVRIENSHGQTPIVVGVLVNSVACVQLLQEVEFSRSPGSITGISSSAVPSTPTTGAASDESSDIDKLLSAIIPKPEGCDYEVLEALRSFVDETQQTINTLEEQLEGKKRNETKYSTQILSLSASLRSANEEVEKEKQRRLQAEAAAAHQATELHALHTLHLATATRCLMLESVAQDAYNKLKKERRDRAKSEESLYHKLQQSLDQNASLVDSLRTLQMHAPSETHNGAKSEAYQYESLASGYPRSDGLSTIQFPNDNKLPYVAFQAHSTQTQPSAIAQPARKRNSKHNVKWGEVRSGDVATPIVNPAEAPSASLPPPHPSPPSSPSRIQAVWNRFYENMDYAAAPSSEISPPVQPKGSLFDPIRRGDLHTLQTLLLSGCSPNQRDPAEKGTPLHLACELGDLDTVMLLCEFAADLEAKDEDDNTPLLASCIQGNFECTKFLLQSAANLNVVNKNRETALHVAAWDGSAECVTILLEYGIDTSLTNSFGLTALGNLKTRSPLRHKFDDMGPDHPIIQTIRILERYETQNATEFDDFGAEAKMQASTPVTPVSNPSSQTQALNSTWKSWLFGFGGGQQPNAESTEEKGEEADSNGEDDSFSSNDDADQDASTFQPAALKPLTPPPEIQEVLRHAKQQQP